MDPRTPAPRDGGLIDAAATLAAVLPLLEHSPWLALDTEADSLHSYPEKVCLIQVSCPGHDLLIDPLAGVDLAPLWRALAPRTLILHGADYDLRMLYRGYGFVPAGVFDTMLAARLAGLSAFGLADLVQVCLGLKIEKGPQRANWSLRPLTERLLTYARGDTHHLKPLADLLRTRLIEQGRLAWHDQMCGRLIEECTGPGTGSRDEAWRLKGSDRLDRRGLGILHELWHWREREALRMNRPPYFILSHEALLTIAGNAAAGAGYDGALPRSFSPRRREGVRAAVRKGIELPEARLPQKRRTQGQRLPMSAARRLEELRHHRDAQAKRLGLDPSLIASRSTLVALAADWAANQAQLLPWQRQMLESHGSAGGAPR